MINIQWTPRGNITGWNGGVTYYAGVTYTGLPYGQPVFASYVPWSTDLAGFLNAVSTIDSKMYTSYSSYGARAPYYSTDCSAFVSWAWGLGSRQTTVDIPRFATQISTSSYENAQAGDCLCLAMSHVVLITDITYDSVGTVNGIEISESTVNAATNYCCQKTRYGVGGSFTLEDLTAKYFANGYILYRSKTRESVAYSHSCAVPLEGDICYACGLGEFEETPVNLVVIGAQDIALYASPGSNTNRIGTVYVGNEIQVTAQCEDGSGVLWYKTENGAWIKASETQPVCRHSYSSTITTAPGCVLPGSGSYTCMLCGDSYTVSLPAKGHDYESTRVPASCEGGGYTEHTCLGCGECCRDGEMPPLGHSFEGGNCVRCGAEDTALLNGDLNGDGEHTSADSVLLARYLADLQTLDETQRQSADINEDGAVTSADAVLLVKMLVE